MGVDARSLGDSVEENESLIAPTFSEYKAK